MLLDSPSSRITCASTVASPSNTMGPLLRAPAPSLPDRVVVSYDDR